VFCVGYRLRRWGEKLPVEEVKARPGAGVVILERIHGMNEGWAQFFDPRESDPAKDELCSARVTKIAKGGMLIDGLGAARWQGIDTAEIRDSLQLEEPPEPWRLQKHPLPTLYGCRDADYLDSLMPT